MTSRMDKTEWRWLLALLLAAAVFRFYAAVYYSFFHGALTDYAVNAMMARHIAEGRHFPLILYNSPYVGTFELYIGAILTRLMPPSLLPTLLGFSLVSSLALPFFYFWTRRMAGARAARYGLALLVIGPPQFFMLNAFSGYAAVLLCGLAACWLTARILDRPESSGRLGRDAFLFGFFAGLGWWTLSLTAVFLVPCAILIALFAPRKGWAILLAGASAGFLLGAGPWIVYSITDAAAVQFVTDVSLVRGGGFVFNARKAVHMIPPLLGFGYPGSRPLHLAAAAALVLLLLGSLASWILPRNHGVGAARRNAKRLMPWLIIVFNIAICGVSRRFDHVPALRYLLPVFPAVAVLAGIGAAWLAARRPRWGKGPGLALVAIIIIWHFSLVPDYWDEGRREKVRADRGRVEELAAFCEEKGIEALYGDFGLQWMSFASNERLKITSFPNFFDRYRPFREAAILTENLGVLNNYYGADRFLAATGARADTGTAGGLGLHWNLRRPGLRFDHLPPGEVALARWEDGSSAREIMDDNLDTPLSAWHHDRTRRRGGERTVRLDFRSPQRVVGVHAWGPSGYWGSVLRVTANGENGAPTILYDGHYLGWFWSGGYPFLAGYLTHCEVLFPAVTVDSLSVAVSASGRDGTPLVSELRVLTERSPSAGESARSGYPAQELVDQLRENPPRMLYAPRWLAENVRRSLPAIPNLVPADYYRQYDGLDRYPAYPVVEMDRLDGAALVVPDLALERTTELLQRRGWVSEISSDLGPYTVLRVRDNPRGDASDRLYWTEYGAFLALDHWPAEPDDVEGFLPLLSGPVRFRRGVTLESVAIESNRLHPGSEARMVYRWRCDPGINPHRLAVFVHFRQEWRIRFQDDHLWLGAFDPEAIARQPDDWVFTTVRAFRIPEDAPPGEYLIALGLYDPHVTLERLKPRGRVKLENKAVILPEALFVEEAGEATGKSIK